MKKLNLKILSIIILGLAGIILCYLIHEINNTKKSLAESLLQKPMESAQTNLRAFFKPVQSVLISIKGQAQLGLFDSITPQLMNRYFGPILANYSQISSIGIANTNGFEFNVIPRDSFIDNRIVWIDQWGMKEHWSTWKNSLNQGNCVFIKEWEDTVKNDPRDRAWFKGAINAPNGQINWTEPYVYNTTFEVGTTASICWSKDKVNKQYILALDLTLSDITKFTQTLKVSPNGKVFVLTKDGKYIGLPKDSKFSNEDFKNRAVLKAVDSTQLSAVSDAYSYWRTGFQPTKSFEFKNEGKQWWGKLTNFELSPGNSFIIGVVVPETDILSKVNRTKRVIIGSFLFVLILTGFVLYWYGKSRKANLLLSVKNDKINQQKMIIQNKSDEIVDSINYAKRIQKAMLPPGHAIKKKLPNSFVLYKPKDIVSGDFYWLEVKNDWIMFAAADCTGHGVPGAIVSVICKNGLSRSIREHEEVDPGQTLNTTRKIVLQEFEKSAEEMTDGMDIALCALKGNHLKFAGANNPLWIIRKGTEAIEEYKGSKQPIGKFDFSTDFKTHDIILNEGDTLYIFSDGIIDQFGGERGKKFKSNNFKKLLLSIQTEDMETQKEMINHAFEEWKKGVEQLDDVCVMGVRV